MQFTPAEIKSDVRQYIIAEFLYGEQSDAIKDDTALLTTGILDSIGTVKLVAFLEEKYGIELEAHEISVDFLNTLDDIANIVELKQSGT